MPVLGRLELALQLGDRAIGSSPAGQIALALARVEIARAWSSCSLTFCDGGELFLLAFQAGQRAGLLLEIGQLLLEP